MAAIGAGIGAGNADCNLHVTGLPTGATDEQVTAIFAQYGTVKSVKVLPSRSEKTDSAAIITMDNAQQAQWLIDNVNGKVPSGLTTPLVIKKKIVSDWNKGWGKGGGMGYGMPPWMMQQMMWYGKGKGKGKSSGLSSFPAEKKVWVGGLPETGVTFRELQAHFPGSKFATVMTGKGAGTGGVAFGTAEEATAALETLNGSTLAEATIVVDVWTKKEKEEPSCGLPMPPPAEAAEASESL